MDELAKMPGIGPKTAQRLAFYILKIPAQEALSLAAAIQDVKEKVRYCSTCFNLTEEDPCAICRDATRDSATICVVEEANDLLALEKTSEYRGLYHVLGGALSPLDGIGPDDLHINELLDRLPQGITEVILATNPNVEGEATAQYIHDMAQTRNIRTTRIAQGVPMGGELEYVDGATLAHAFRGRSEF